MPTREEKEKRIKEEAKRILDKFAKALEKIKEIPDSFVEREKDRREEKGEKDREEKEDSDFRRIFFENAPATKKDSIQAEKGGWK